MGSTDTSEPFLTNENGEFITTPLNQRYRTPNMERLARRGRKFVNARAYTVCTPTRASLITGLEAPRLHITTYTDPSRPSPKDNANGPVLKSPEWTMSGVDPKLPTLPGILQQNGYRTIHCGKAHFGPNSTPAGNPKNLGFEVNIAGHGAGRPGSYYGKDNYDGSKRQVPGLEKYHGTDTFLTEALTLELKKEISASQEKKQPFFAYMAHYAVHGPFQADPRFTQNYPKLKGRALAFATMVEGMDKSLGDLMDHLEKLGIAEETIIVFYSDNGTPAIPNLPLRGIKGTRYLGGHHVPMIASWAKPNPNHPLQKTYPIPSDSIDTNLVQPADFLPTLVSASGSPLPAGSKFDGYDLSEDLKGTPGTHRPQQFLSHFPHRRGSDALFTTFTNGDWKLLYDYQKKEYQLTNIRYDLSEKQNLCVDKPALAISLAKGMIKKMKSLGAQPPIDIKSGKPAWPDLAPLNALLKKHQAASKKAPLENDNLDLIKLVQPIGPDNIYRDPGFYTWCNSIIQGPEGKYHLFYVRWPKKYGFYAWLTHSEIAHAVSDQPAGPYQFQDLAIPARGEFAWNQINAHNVKIKTFNGKFYLYFIATNDGGKTLSEEDLIKTAKVGYRSPNWPILRNNQLTGVAVSDSLSGPWKVSSQPAIEPHGPISTVTVNPAIWQDASGKFRMVIKGDYPPTRLAQAVAVSDQPTGPFKIQPELAFDRYSEDVSVWQDPSRGLTYGILHDTKGFGLIVSQDGISWQDAKHFRAMDKTVPTLDGPPLKPSRFERPAVFAAKDGTPLVLSSAAQFNGGKDAHIILIPLKATDSKK